LNITFLGTGTSQGVPVIGCDCEVCRSLDFRDKRLRTSIHLQVDDKSIVIDTGPDFRQQMLREDIKDLDAVVYTHEHKDHTAGLDDIRPFNFRHQKDIPIFARKLVLEQIKQEYAYIFSANSYPGVPRVLVNEIINAPFAVEGVSFTPIEVLHHKLPVFGFRIKDFTYITDANYISEEEMEKVYGTKVLVLNALRLKSHISHFTLEEAVQLIKKINPEKAYLTHISHQMGIHRKAEMLLPNNIHLAYDGLQIAL